MNSDVLKIFDVIEDIKHEIKENQYKIVMESLMKISKDKEKEKLDIEYRTQEEIIYVYTQKDFDEITKVMVNLSLNIFFVFSQMMKMMLSGLIVLKL